MKYKPRVMITFSEGGANGGPYNSHKRILESSLREKYTFIPLMIPKGRIGILNIKLLRFLVKEISNTKPDILHFSGLQLEGFHVALACKLAGIKNSLLAIHGSSLEAVDFPMWKKNIVNILEIITLRLSKGCYGVSEYVINWKRVKKYSKKCYGHIYNIPKTIQTQVDRCNSFRDELNIHKNDIVIVSTGRITKEKGYELLLQLILTMDIPINVKFVIVGNGDYIEEFKKQINQKKLERSVFFLGYRNDIDRILKESNIFIILSLHETLCMSLLEAGYYGLPSIATNIGGIPEIIEDGKNGYLVKPKDIDTALKRIKSLIQNPELREQMGENAKNIVETKFSTIEIEEKIDKIYRSLINAQ